MSIKTLEELVENAHDTYKLDCHFIDYRDLPKKAKEALVNAEPEVDTSSYVCGEPTAFIRADVEFPDGTASLEIHLGRLPDPREDGYISDDEEEEWTEERLEEWQQNYAAEMKSCFEWEYNTVYFDADYKLEE